MILIIHVRRITGYYPGGIQRSFIPRDSAPMSKPLLPAIFDRIRTPLSYTFFRQTSTPFLYLVAFRRLTAVNNHNKRNALSINH